MSFGANPALPDDLGRTALGMVEDSAVEEIKHRLLKILQPSSG
jgi:hypothetical protein